MTEFYTQIQLKTEDGTVIEEWTPPVHLRLILEQARQTGLTASQLVIDGIVEDIHT